MKLNIKDLRAQKKAIESLIKEAVSEENRQAELFKIQEERQFTKLLKLNDLGKALRSAGLDMRLAFLAQSSEFNTKTLAGIFGVSARRMDRMQWSADWELKRMASYNESIRELARGRFDYNGFPIQKGSAEGLIEIRMDGNYEYRSGGKAVILTTRGRLDDRPVISEMFNGHIYKHDKYGRFHGIMPDPADLIEVKNEGELPK